MDFNGRMSMARGSVQPGSSQNRRQEEIDAFMIVGGSKYIIYRVNN